MILRTDYLKKMKQYRNKDVIIVISGIRRSGKSVLLKQYEHQLKTEGVPESEIISINFESLKYNFIENFQDLYNYVVEKSHGFNHVYLMFDEIQRVEKWEKALNSFMVDINCDIIITGSNADLLSSELSTYLTGRYIEIHMLPLSYKEYCELNGVNQPHLFFKDYIFDGGFPGMHRFKENNEGKRDYLEGIFDSVLVKDIISRSFIREVDLLEALLLYTTDNIGNLISANNIASYMTSNGRKTAVSTVVHYLKALEKAFVLYKARRYDIRGKRLLNSPDKYYIVDQGFRTLNYGYTQPDTGRVLENVVYLELIRRGYQVYVGSNKGFEIDFIASKASEKIYIQVTLSLQDIDVKEREIRGFIKIDNNYPKMILSMDYVGYEEYNGISHMNIVDWLLESPQ